MTEELFRDDAYLQRCTAVVIAADDGVVELDRTVFYPTAGGQPGDTGRLVLDGLHLTVTDTRKGARPGQILHSADDEALPVGCELLAEIDWPRRHRLMRMHTCLHLLCRAVDGTVTGGAVGPDKGRLDFDLPEARLDKDELAARINAWIDEDHAVCAHWIDEDELDRRPDLVRTMSVSPPRGSGRIRLIDIDGLDLQACGGTHVRSTREIGPVRIGKIENKGRQNRRVTVHFAED
ncbi:MAG: alanyl-tRNA editing protein [Geminicoccaceae bacterium]|nr:alanyl-tRNA editing protein [Geminicoccaceae bacterium]